MAFTARRARRTWSLLLAAVACAAGVLLTQWPGAGSAQPADAPVRVTGTLVLGMRDAAENLTDISLPDRKVVLRRNGQQDVDSAVTALDGRFELTAPAPGVYQVCWELGGAAGCGNRLVANRATAWAGLVRARLERPAVFGTVLTGDGRPCWANDAFFGLDVSTLVRGGGASTRANTRGEYVLVGPAPGTFRVTARCEGASTGATVTLANAALRRDLSLGSRAPRLTGLSAHTPTKGVTRAAPGETVKLAAAVRASGAGPVQFAWRTADASSGVLAGGSGDTQSWTLPASPGLHSAYVMVRDGRGGFAYKRLDMQVGGSDIEFSGRVVAEGTQQPVPDASVTVGAGTASARTNADGWFRLSAPAQDDERYVLNIAHPDYALLSRIADRSAVGNTYELVRAQVSTVRGDQPIVIDDRESDGPCGPRGQHQRPIRRLVGPSVVWDETPADRRAAAAQRRAEARILQALREPRGCERRGAQIQIPANALVDDSGAAWAGEVRAAVTTLDPSRRAIPGDYQAITAGGERAEMLSYGALHVDLTDPAGRRLNLRPGTPAEIAVPAFAVVPSSLPPEIATWSYDEKTGLWREESRARLQSTPQGLMYVGQAAHFSTLNMDVAGTDPAHATCVRFEVDAAFNAWSNLTIRAYVSYGGTQIQVKETPLDGAQYHAVYRIPFDTGFVNTLRLELRGTFGGQNLVLLDNIIATDARPKMTGTNLWPPYPYAECGAAVLLAPAAGVVPPYGDLDATGRPAFLSGPFGAFNPADGAAKAAAYYAAIDPTGAKDTLGKWWQANGFGVDGLGAGNPSYVRQAYMNFNDLGFGRDMHCAKTGSNLACYVTNYGLPDQNPANADAAATRDPARQGATVAMEYDHAAPVTAALDERVQFYVFGGGVATSGRIQFADLDGFGPKPVPFLCLVCHGGPPDLTASNKASFARFREFDLPSFRYSSGRSWDFGATTLSAAELDSLAKLNQLVHNAPASTAITDLIDRWYPGGLGSGAPVLPAPPAGWAAQAAGYHNVYGKSCRTCHVARDEGDPGAFFLLGSSAQFAGTGYSVCGTGSPKRRVMPNAVVTYKNFWADSLRVQMYETLTGQASGTCGN